MEIKRGTYIPAPGKMTCGHDFTNGQRDRSFINYNTVMRQMFFKLNKSKNIIKLILSIS